MKLVQINDEAIKEQFEQKGYVIPSYDREKIREKTAKEPAWVHFGTGNIFRAFPAAVLDKLLSDASYDKGVIAVEGFDYDIIEKAYIATLCRICSSVYSSPPSL